MESGGPEEDYFAKLEIVKQIRQKTIVAEKMKLSMKDMIEELEKEENSLKEYQAELDLLIQEKMAHVEELRLIHTDINTMEDLTKQARAARQKILDNIKKVHGDFTPLKNMVNELRLSVGVPLLQEPENLPDSLVNGSQPEVPDVKPNVQEIPQPPSIHMSLPPEGLGTSILSIPKPTIRQQQPAPMKSCQSCHQLIHRNAPICPLCKAKSRSRNPKKTKRRSDGQ